jgi:hypothetical protein
MNFHNASDFHYYRRKYTSINRIIYLFEYMTDNG